jgi:outer membrane protein TolC
MIHRTHVSRFLWLAVLSACSVSIDGEQAERDRAKTLGARYEKPFADRELPPLQPDSDLAAWIAHAESSNGELEAAYYEWLAAIEEVPQAATQDTTAMIGLEHTLDGGSALDRTGLMLMTDTMANWVLPGRLRDRGHAALLRARAAGSVFVTRRLALQREVAERSIELAMRDREIELQERLLRSLGVAAASARAQVQSGQASQRVSVTAETEQLRAQAMLVQLRQGRPALVAELLATAGVAMPSALDPAPSLPELAPLRAEELATLDAAIAHNPSLLEARARHEAVLAQITADEWEHMPQFSLRSLLMGDGTAMLQPAMTLPFLRDHAISAKLRASRAAADGAAAMLRQEGLDAAATILAERARHDAAVAEAAVLRDQVLPRLQRTALVARGEWTASRAQLRDWLEIDNTATAVELELVRLQGTAAITRARLLAALGSALTAPLEATTAESLPTGVVR